MARNSYAVFGMGSFGSKLALALARQGNTVLVCDNNPQRINEMRDKVTEAVIGNVANADVVNLLRIQHERQTAGFFPSTGEYARFFGINEETLKYMKKDALIMPPGPINRDVELSTGVADGPQSVILEQVTNGLAVRMAVLYLVSGCVQK